MDADALLREADGECCWVRPVFVAILDGVIGDKPVVATAAFVFAFRMPPALDVGFVSIGNTASAPIKWYFS